MHQFIGQFTRTGQEQQPFSVEIKTSHRLPFALKQLGKTPEHCGPVLGIVVRHNFTRGLVIRDHPGRRRVNTDPDGLSVDFYRVAKLDALTYVGRLSIYGNAALQYQLLHLKSRSETSLR